MNMTLQYETFTSKEAAGILGVTDARVRQLCISYENIGKKHGHAWILSSDDIAKIRSLPEFRKKTA
jgi:hypothetical protein